MHLKAQKSKLKRVSEAAVSTFGESLEKEGVTVDQAKWKEELFAHGEPLQDEVTAYWQRVLTDEASVTQGRASTLLESLQKHAEAAPASSDYEGRSREGTAIVEDPKAYRSHLRLTDSPKPVMDWGDLPQSKL